MIQLIRKTLYKVGIYQYLFINNIELNLNGIILHQGSNSNTGNI